MDHAKAILATERSGRVTFVPNTYCAFRVFLKQFVTNRNVKKIKWIGNKYNCEKTKPIDEKCMATPVWKDGVQIKCQGTFKNFQMP